MHGDGVRVVERGAGGVCGLGWLDVLSQTEGSSDGSSGSVVRGETRVRRQIPAPAIRPSGMAPGDGGGMPHTLGTADSSVLYTLALSIDRVPRVELHDTDVVSRGRSGGTPADERVTSPNGRPERIRLFGVLGRGGMGVVLKGHDTDLGRDLAVKVLQEQFRDEPEMIRRFVEEAQIGGQLQHPGVVPVYELGSLEDRRPYIAMQLVNGRTLAELLAARRRPDDDLPRLLGIFESVCQTMAYAHARG